MKLPQKATRPTMYFIGVTTAQSSIMQLFPLWAEALGLKDAVIKGIDIEINADPEDYKKVVKFIKEDGLSLGALVTTHKIDLFDAAKDMFDYLDMYAKKFGEISSISKKDGRLEGYAKDPITSGLALEAFIPKEYFAKHGGEVFILGAGGSGVALASYLLKKGHGKNAPSRIVISNRSEKRLNDAVRKLEDINPDVPIEFIQASKPEQNNEILNTLKPYSLIANATGLGKDRPGSPITNHCIFPQNSLVWEFNYRGELNFMHQANAQKEKRNLYVENGWIYFIRGWTQVIAEVFHIEITSDFLERCEKIAAGIRK
jgi:shikimate dehydrogenase